MTPEVSNSDDKTQPILIRFNNVSIIDATLPVLRGLDFAAFRRQIVAAIRVRYGPACGGFDEHGLLLVNEKTRRSGSG